EGGKLIDVRKYVDYFTLPASMGGVKADPRDAILAQIAAPAEPVSVSLRSQCSPGVQCAYVNPSCTSPTNSSFFGDPTVRLSALITSAATSQLWSLCDTDYSGALGGIAQKIVARLE